MAAYIFDIVIVLILAFFAWRGAKKGLILTLCGLVGIFVAFFGARFVSARFYEPISNIIEPAIYQSVLGAGSESKADNTVTGRFPTSEQDASYTLEELLDALREADLFSGFSDFLDDAVGSDSLKETATRTAAQALADYLSKLIAKAGLFALSFLLILLLWFLVGHLLDLAFHLPILSAVNWVGGLVLGLAKAVLLVLVLVWLGQLVGFIPGEPTTPILSLFTPRSVGAFLNKLVV